MRTIGADIHPYIEIKVDGAWIFYAQPIHHRNYWIFSVLAGVRNDGAVVPYKEPMNIELEEFVDIFKRMGEPLSTDVARKCISYGQDGHSHISYSLEELDECIEQSKMMKKEDDDEWKNYICTWQEIMHKLIEAEAADDARVIIWFDN